MQVGYWSLVILWSLVLGIWCFASALCLPRSGFVQQNPATCDQVAGWKEFESLLQLATEPLHAEEESRAEGEHHPG